MIANINSDDFNLTNTNKATVVEKVSAVPAILSVGGSPANGNQLHGNAATTDEHDAATKEVSRSELDDTVRDLNEHMQIVKRELHFSVDSDSGQTVIKVMDLATQQVVRQTPNEEALKAARSLGAGFDLELFNEYT